MQALKTIRKSRSISQRRLASLAGTSYKTIQLLEKEGQDFRLSTLENVLSALGYPKGILQQRIQGLLEQPIDSVSVLSYSLKVGAEGSWRIYLFNFVDAFRGSGDKASLIREPPLTGTLAPLQALLASTVEALCAEAKIGAPDWCEGIPALQTPWFPGGVEDLKASALVESPASFCKRNIFVLGNFLDRL